MKQTPYKPTGGRSQPASPAVPISSPKATEHVPHQPIATQPKFAGKAQTGTSASVTKAPTPITPKTVPPQVPTQPSIQTYLKDLPEADLPPNDIQQIKDCFSYFDELGNGIVKTADILQSFMSLSPETLDPVVKKVLNDLEAVGGEIDFEIFLRIIGARIGNSKTSEGVHAQFELYDIDEKGYIDFNDIKRVQIGLGEDMSDEEIHKMMHYIHVLNKTENKEKIFPKDFEHIILKKI